MVGRKKRYENIDEGGATARWVNRQLARSPFALPLMAAAVGLALGFVGFAIAGEGSPFVVQVFSLVLISVAAVLLLFAFGALVSAVVVAFMERRDGNDRNRDA